MANANKEHLNIKVDFLTCLYIALKNGWPLMGTAVVAFVLIFFLGTNCRLWKLPLDASDWPTSIVTTAPEGKALTLNESEKKVEGLPHSKKKPLDVDGLHRILAATTFLLVLFNTYLYLRDSRDDPLEKHNRRLKSAWNLTFFFEILTIIWVIKIVLGGRVAKFDDEIAAFLMFAVFTYVDWVTYRIVGPKQHKTPSDLKLQEEYRFALGQTLFVDVPVVVGILISISLAIYLDHQFSEAEHYIVGVFSGATVMHLASSQVIFFLLAFKKDYSLAKGSSMALPDCTAANPA